MNLLRLFAIFALLLLASATAQAEETLLRWKFTAGQKFRVESTQQTEVVTSINNKPQRASLEMSMQLEWVVDEVSDEGVATMTQSFERLALKTIAPGAEPVVYDSASDVKPIGAAREIAAGIAPLVGAKFTVKLDTRGEVLVVKLSEDAEKALTALPDESQVKALLSPEGLTNLFRLGGGTLPEKAVSPGDTWPSESTQETPYGKLVQTGHFTLAEPLEKLGVTLQKITLASTATLEPKADAELKLKVQEQTKTGELLFNSTAGHVTEASSQLVSKSTRIFRNTEIRVQIQSETKLTIEVGE